MQEGNLTANNIKTPTMERYGNNDDRDMIHVPDEDDRPSEEPTIHGLNAYINAEVLLPVGGEMKSGRV